MEKLIYEGAEGKIYKIDEKTLKKIRLKKSYRHEELDSKLRRSRTRREFKILTKLKENSINSPKPHKLNDKNEFSIEMELLEGQVLKETITKEKLKLACKQIKKMHDCKITHGDLTTLNMIDQDNKIYIIDFGLAQFSTKAEDKAVDLHLFWNCIKNEHNELFYLKEELIKIYDKQTLEKLENLEKRGRNK